MSDLGATYPWNGSPSVVGGRELQPVQGAAGQIGAAASAWWKGRPGEPGAVQFRDYSVKPSAQGVGVAEGQVIDGILDGSWAPNVLLLGTSPQQLQAAAAAAAVPSLTTALPGLALGTTTVVVVGLTRGGLWLRQFDLPAWSKYQIDLRALRDVRVAVVSSGLVDWGLDVVATDAIEPVRQDVAYLRTSVTASGSYLTPWGADELVPATNDPGFAWRSGALTAGSPAFTGVEKPVAAGEYRTGGAFSALWRIRL